MNRFLLLCLFCVCATNLFAQSKNTYPPNLPDARAEVYKTIGDVEMKLWVFKPEGNKPTDRRPAIVFFFGGGWKAGSPEQFSQHCRYLASRGMVAITADYHVATRHGTLADQCVKDGKSAIRWVRKNSDRLGIDPDRIVAAGGSAGGHVAACTATIDDFDEKGEDVNVSSRPNALALFNPAVVIAPYSGMKLDEEKLADIATRTGVGPEAISPLHQLSGELPPTIIFHGKADDTVPYFTVDEFGKKARGLGGTCRVEGYDGEGHGFFNYGRNGVPGESYLRTVRQLDEFLVSLRYLEGPPSVAVPASKHAHLRSSLDNSRLQFERGKTGTVAFIGGSITEMNGYRPMICDYLQERFPETEFDFVAAGISSTCSTTGSFRLARDVLSKNPDLFFVEFAVNDDQDAGHAARECVRGMEGILRQALTHDPEMDIVVTHFVNPTMLEKLSTGKQPVSSSQHERVAKHYGVSSSYLAAELADRIKQGTITWKQYGGTHPKKPGNRLAADLAIQIMESAWAKPLSKEAESEKHRLAKRLDQKSYAQGHFVSVDQADDLSGFEVRKPDWASLPGGKRSRYTDQMLLCATKPRSTFTFSFQGTAVGAFLLAGPDAGTVEYSIDGGPFQTIDLFHHYSRGLHYPRSVVFDADLKNAKHELFLRVADTRNDKSKGSAVRILQLEVNGAK